VKKNGEVQGGKSPFFVGKSWDFMGFSWYKFHGFHEFSGYVR
jgi:hypothetical protein